MVTPVDSGLHPFRVFGVDIKLASADGVFMPSPHGLFYSSVVHIEPRDRVIDIGTGSGVLAIAAAKRGAEVVVTDIDARAVAAAERNAQRNEVRLYLGVHAITDFHSTLHAALRAYEVRLLDLRELPAKPFVIENIDYYLSLAREGVIELFQNVDGRWRSYGYMYELRLPSSGR